MKSKKMLSLLIALSVSTSIFAFAPTANAASFTSSKETMSYKSSAPYSIYKDGNTLYINLIASSSDRYSNRIVIVPYNQFGEPICTDNIYSTSTTFDMGNATKVLIEFYVNNSLQGSTVVYP